MKVGSNKAKVMKTFFAALFVISKTLDDFSERSKIMVGSSPMVLKSNYLPK